MDPRVRKDDVLARGEIAFVFTDDGLERGVRSHETLNLMLFKFSLKTALTTVRTGASFEGSCCLGSLGARVDERAVHGCTMPSQTQLPSKQPIAIQNIRIATVP